MNNDRSESAGPIIRRSVWMVAGLMIATAISACAERPSDGTSGGRAASGTVQQPATGSASSSNTTSTSAPSSGAHNSGASMSSSGSDSGKSSAASTTLKPGTEQAMFGAGCFWGVEHIYRTQIPGVIDAVSGYAGGRKENPSYQDVCTGTTGHVEVVLVTFDTAKTNYDAIVDAFFRMHDPTQVNRQGPDIGEQYRSVVYCFTPEQEKIASAVKARRQSKHDKPIATTVEPAPKFYKAEEYHQKYYIRKGTQPYCHTLRED